MLERPAFFFPSTLSVRDENGKNASSMPTLEEWTHLWKAFDTTTLDMVNKDLLHTKPIDLRHICLFYVRPL